MESFGFRSYCFNPFGFRYFRFRSFLLSPFLFSPFLFRSFCIRSYVFALLTCNHKKEVLIVLTSAQTNNAAIKLQYKDIQLKQLKIVTKFDTL